MFEAAQAYLTALRDGDPPTIRQLIKLLDDLVGAYHTLPASQPDDADHTQPGDSHVRWQSWMLRLNECFPDFGYYADSDPLADPLSEPTIGNAYDDLADIARDLEEYIWRHENVSAADANWHVRFTFEIHWGRHCRDVSRYLHAKQFYG